MHARKRRIFFFHGTQQNNKPPRKKILRSKIYQTFGKKTQPRPFSSPFPFPNIHLLFRSSSVVINTKSTAPVSDPQRINTKPNNPIRGNSRREKQTINQKGTYLLTYLQKQHTHAGDRERVKNTRMGSSFYQWHNVPSIITFGKQHTSVLLVYLFSCDFCMYAMSIACPKRGNQGREIR
ncbi:hypothetical protein DM02DRAFT_181248 [Periconia macrospinosa]|uniref:Uncharacterized protein n=1 Tax=Periconia macrospinosa TaxID=97972 RepID=A0A2V1D9J7_9PLEO|nr:hypothetical protein DM02DRAFT_181248 [Periconia macrospinosa]